MNSWFVKIFPQNFMLNVIQRDFPVVQAAIMVTATAIFAMNIIIDLLYVALDPRIRHQ